MVQLLLQKDADANVRTHCIVHVPFKALMKYAQVMCCQRCCQQCTALEIGIIPVMHVHQSQELTTLSGRCRNWGEMTSDLQCHAAGRQCVASPVELDCQISLQDCIRLVVLQTSHVTVVEEAHD